MKANNQLFKIVKLFLLSVLNGFKMWLCKPNFPKKGFISQDFYSLATTTVCFGDLRIQLTDYVDAMSLDGVRLHVIRDQLRLKQQNP